MIVERTMETDKQLTKLQSALDRVTGKKSGVLASMGLGRVRVWTPELFCID